MKTAVITTGGLGTRLLTSTKGNPKAMLPLYDKSHDNIPDPLLRPLIEIIFENLYDYGFRRFCFIVSKKTKSSILNHLVPDSSYINLLKKRDTNVDRRFIKTLLRLYKKMNNCEVSWISQVTPMGFGHALLSASKFVGTDTFLLHAGDAYFPRYEFLPNFIRKHQNDRYVSGTLLLQRKKHLEGYGIAQLQKRNKEEIVFHVEEKPKKPLSNMVILPVYIFESNIFEALKRTPKGHNNELQVTDAIKSLINKNEKILGFNIGKEKWFDIGSTRNYFKAITYSYRNAIR